MDTESRVMDARGGEWGGEGESGELLINGYRVSVWERCEVPDMMVAVVIRHVSVTRYVTYILPHHKKENKIWAFATTWMNPESMMLSEIRQGKTKSV